MERRPPLYICKAYFKPRSTYLKYIDPVPYKGGIHDANLSCTTKLRLILIDMNVKWKVWLHSFRYVSVELSSGRGKGGVGKKVVLVVGVEPRVVPSKGV